MEPEGIVPGQATRYGRALAAKSTLPPPHPLSSASPTTTSSSKNPPKLCPLSHQEQFPGCISSLFPDTRRPSLLTVSVSSSPSSPSSSSPSFTSPTPPSPTNAPCIVPPSTWNRDKPLPAGHTYCIVPVSTDDALPPQVITVASVDSTTTQSTTLFDVQTSATYVPSPSGPLNYGEDTAWKPPPHYNTIAVAVTVPITCVALLGVLAWFLYGRRRQSSADAPPETAMASNSATTPEGGRGAGGIPSSALAAMNIWHRPDFSRTRAANRNSIIAGLGLGRENEDDTRRWTMRGYRAYGDGVRRPPPVSPLSAAILRRGGDGGSSGGEGSENNASSGSGSI